MNSRKRILQLASIVILAPSLLVAQEEADKADESVTHQGLTGLFNLVSPDTMDRGQLSFGMVHRNWDRELTDLDVNDLSAAFAIGVTDRLELGFAYVAHRQPDFDDPFSPRFYNALPRAITTIESGSGDLSLAAKIALARMEEGGGGVSLLGSVKLPTGDETEGRGTGGTDFRIGVAAGYERDQVGIYGNAGYRMVGDTSSDIGEIDLANVFEWGAGLEVGAQYWLRGVLEFTGEVFTDEPSGLPPQENAVDLAVGFKIGGARHGGIGIGAAYVRNLSMDETDPPRLRPNGWVGEISFTTAEAPPPAPAPVDGQLNRAPSVTVTANPREVAPSYSSKTNQSTVTAVASDPDGDSLSYAWSASGGRVSGSGPSVTWFPPEGATEGSFTVTCRVADGKGGEASGSDSIRVVADPEFFEGRVFFEFDRYDLDDEDRAVIRAAAEHLARFPDLRLTVEGHACYIATEEYNLVLGQHRADAIRTALVGSGVDEARLQTISYGEARPWQDNSREVTRRLNRRGEFRFKFSQ